MPLAITIMHVAQNSVENVFNHTTGMKDIVYMHFTSALFILATEVGPVKNSV